MKPQHEIAINSISILVIVNIRAFHFLTGREIVQENSVPIF